MFSTIVNVLVSLVTKYPFWTGFATGAASDRGLVIISPKVKKMIKYKMGKR